MRNSSSRGWSLVLGVVALGILCLRLLGPHLTRPNTGSAIRDQSLISPLNQPGGGEVSADAYEVYSALYQQPQEPLAFAEDSQTDIPQVNGSCLNPSTAQEHEMAAAFVAANDQSHRWEKKFTIPAYLLLSHAEITKTQDCFASRGKNIAGCQAYQSLQHIRFLGVPGFDHTHTRALVSVIKMCGNQCGGGGVFEVEKSGNTWKRSDQTDFFSSCSWMY